jgi:tetratricopeptide (TPR) repeat protein
MSLADSIDNLPGGNRGKTPEPDSVEGLKQSMLEKSLGEIQPVWRELYRTGVEALKKGERDAAMQIFGRILAAEPGFLQCRESLRAAQLERAQTTAGFMKRLVERTRAALWLAEAEFCLPWHPARAICAAEQVLNFNPLNLRAHEVIAKAALRTGLPRTALLSLKFIFERAPEANELALEFAAALAATGEISKAIATCGRLLKEDPTNGPARHLMKRLAESARSSADAPHPHPAGNDDRPGAGGPNILGATKQELESQKEEEGNVPGVIFKYEALLKHGPNNHRVLQKLGALYARKSDFDRALEYYWRALQVAHGKDAESERALAEIAHLKSNPSGAHKDS